MKGATWSPTQIKFPGKLWRKALILTLAFCFCMQVLDVFAKYFREQATVASRVETLDLATLPVVSLCPGFREEGDYYDQVYELWGILEENQEKQSKNEELNLFSELN